MRNGSWWVVAAACAFALDANGLSSSKDLSQYVRATWRVEEGLPQSDVYAIAQTPDGYIWVATQEGVARFDGHRFVIYDRSSNEAIVSNYAMSVLATKSGDLYIGTTAGLIRIQGEKVNSFSSENGGLPSNIVTKLLESSDGAIWVGTTNGLWRYASGRFVRIAGSLPHETITALTEDPSGRVWIGTMDGVASWSNGEVRVHEAEDGFAREEIHALCSARDGSLWLGTANGLKRYRAGELRIYGAAEGVKKASVNAIYEDRQGVIWIGTLSQGFGRVRNDHVEFESGKSYSVTSFMEDREGNLWIATTDGVTRLADGVFISYTEESGVVGDVKSVHADTDGRIWVGTIRGLQLIGSNDVIKPRPGLSSDTVLTSLTARDGSVWIGTYGGLNHVKNGRNTQYGLREGLPALLVLTVYEDRRGRIWAGTANGLVRIVDGRVETLDLSEPLTGQVVDTILEDRRGAIWVGTQHAGLKRIVGSQVDSFTVKQGLSNNLVASLYEDSSGVLWIGTGGGGLNRLKDGKIASISTTDGLYNDNVFSILEDDDANFWMSCNKGVFRVSLRQLNAVADGRAKRVRSVVYGHGDGMSSAECNGGTQPVATKSPDGRLWFATTRGVAVIDPRDVTTAPETIPVLIESILADGRKIASGATMPAGTRTVEFNYTSPTFKTPEKVVFHYRLDGFDNHWVNAGSRRTAFYTSLPPGDYTFRVQATYGDAPNERGVHTATFNLQPFFYQTVWFWVLVALAVIALASYAIRWRIGIIRASAERFKLLFDRNLAGVYRATIDGRILDCNTACAKIFGFASPDEFASFRLFDSFARREDAEMLLRRLREDGAVSAFETLLRRRDGEPIWVLQNVSLVGSHEHPEVLEATLVDMTDRKHAEERIRFQAYHDTLTELPNRALFKDRLSLALAHAHRHGDQVAVLFLDLDRFKLINDTFGHTVGDHLLQGMAARLKSCLREEDSVARVGGDEFTLLLMDVRNASDATRVARKVLETVARPIMVDGHELFVTCSIGISISPADGEDAETLLKNADNALYRAKEAGKNKYQLCTPSMNRLAAERLALENALRQAIDRSEFLIHYQPQFDLKTREIVGIEALLRWDRPGKGIVRPSDFIAAAEESRLIIPIGEWILENAARQAHAWHGAGFPVRVAVNVSAAQFQHRELVQSIREALKHWAVDPSRLEIEITESTAMQNPDLTAGILRELKDLGISVMIDDFGIGHSSLNYLKRFPIDGLKIDKSFVQDLTRDDSDAAIVSAVIAMAHALHLRVTAEGVESEEQLAFLESKGCHDIQGYLLSRPMPPEALIELLRRQQSEASRSPRPYLPHVLSTGSDH